MNNILITICARGGSRGVRKKNIKELGKFPLIYYSINIAKKFLKNKKGKISLSTDDEEIKLICQDYGIYTEYIRPVNLATDSAGKIDTIRDILLFEEKKTKTSYDMILDLDVSSPLRTLTDLEESFKLFASKKNALNLFSVSESIKNPYFNMVELKDNGFYKLVKNRSIGDIFNRQSAPKVYDLNASFYWYRRSFFDSKFNTVITNKSLIYEVGHICFDIDDELDFLFMKFLYENKKLNFLR
jgi:CMP-N,N'-diacetyllegionaminic acid synthase